jgi:hypothetical protein
VAGEAHMRPGVRSVIGCTARVSAAGAPNNVAAAPSPLCLQALPTIMLFKDGKPVFRHEGAMTEDQLVAMVQKAL